MTSRLPPTLTVELGAQPLLHAPWQDTLAPAAARELRLPPAAEALKEYSNSQIADVAVVGGGVAGLSAALAAATVGARVVLLERERALGQGATGRNAGILSAGINMGLADVPAGSSDAEMWPATTAVLLSLVEEARRPGALLRASLTGALSLAERPGAARHLARETRARTAVGLRAELWTPQQVAEATAGRLSVQSVAAALWLPDEGRIDPLTLLAHLARQARARGVILAGDASVVAHEEVAAAGNQVPRWRLRLASGHQVRARALVSATGPTAAPSARIYALAFRAELPPTFPLFWDAAPYTYCDFRPGDGRLVVSGGRYGRPGASRRDVRYHRRLADEARRWLPELASQGPTHAWAVDLAVSATMVPRIRPLGTTAPGVSIEGLGALGVLPGMVLGRRAGVALAGQLA